MTKKTKAEVKYEAVASMDHKCEDCRFFEQPNGCKKVEGKINPGGWCNLWQRRP